MQKKIIALAVAGLVSGAAFAQSNVQIYGTLDIGYVQGSLDTTATNAAGVKTKTNTDVRSTGVQDGPLSSNLLGFKGSEDLGNGLKANFQLEFGLAESNNFGLDTGLGESTNTGVAIRKQNLGLSGGFGAVTIGRQGVLIDEAWAVGSAGMKNNAYGDMYSSIVGGSGNLMTGGSSGGWVLYNSLYGGASGATNQAYHDIRANELITYVSPNFSGFTFAGQYGTGKVDSDSVATDTRTDHTNWGLRANYDNGPLAVVFGYNSEKNEGTSQANATGIRGTAAVNAVVAGAAVTVPAVAAVTSSDTDKRSWLIGANYNFGIVKVFGQYFDGSRNVDTWTGTTMPAKADADISGWELGVHVPVTAQITLAATYFDTSTDWKTATAAAVPVVAKGDVDGMGYQFAALYSLSKRTTAYAMYGYEEAKQDTKGSLVGIDNDIWNVAAGIKHTF